MCQIGKLTKSRRNMGGVEIIEREIELLKMMKREERIIGMEGAVKQSAREVQSSDLPGFHITSDPIPQAAICTVFP
jgi:hypothetical protein